MNKGIKQSLSKWFIFIKIYIGIDIMLFAIKCPAWIDVKWVSRVQKPFTIITLFFVLKELILRHLFYMSQTVCILDAIWSGCPMKNKFQVYYLEKTLPTKLIKRIESQFYLQMYEIELFSQQHPSIILFNSYISTSL